MKVLGTLRYSKNNKEWFSVRFDDGIVVIIDRVGKDKWVKGNIISIGMDSYYITKDKWPKGKNLEKRIDAAKDHIVISSFLEWHGDVSKLLDCMIDFLLSANAHFFVIAGTELD